MLRANRYLDTLNPADRAVVHQLVDRFEQAWRNGDRPVIADYLPADAPRRRAALVELLHTVLELGLKNGRAVVVEDFLKQFPEIQEDPPMLLDLIAAEYEWRRRGGTDPTPGEYHQRFPKLRAELTTCFAGSTSAPRRLGRYEIQRPLGRGSFGAVYLARDTELDRMVALKVPRLGLLASPEEVGRFLREARSTAQLRHPSIVPVHDAGQSDGLCYLVTEFIPGPTLAQRLEAGRFDFRQAAALTAEMAEALEHAHRQGVIHRDVKPSNILLDAAGRPHLTDFGLAKRAVGEHTLTTEGDLLGTPAYIAPEQARGEVHRIDAHSDLYSLGVTLYQMLTGELPFRGTAPMLLRQVLDEEPRPPRRLDDRLPRDLETICLKCLQKEPAARYASAAALAEDLRRFLAGVPIWARPVGRLSRLVRWCRRQPAAAGLVIALALGLAGTVWQWRRAEINLTEASGQWRRAETNLAEADRQRVQAEQNFVRAWRAVTDFAQVGLHELYEGNPALGAANPEMTEKALKYYEKVLKNYEDFLGRQDVPPELLVEVGEVYLHSARLSTYFTPTRPDRAIAAWRRSLTFWERLLRQQSGVVQCQMGRAESCYELSRLQADPTLRVETVRTLKQTSTFLAGLPSDQVTSSTRFSLYQTYEWTGMLQRILGRPAEALASQQQALAVSGPLAREFPADLIFPIAWARSLYHLATAYADTGHPAEAIRAYQDSAAVWARLAHEHPRASKLRRDLASCYHNLGTLHRDTGRQAAAACFYYIALTMREELRRENPGEPKYASDLDGTRRNLTRVLARLLGSKAAR